MNIKEVLSLASAYFSKHQLKEPRLEAEVLLAHVLKKERIRLYVDFDQPLSKSELEEYRQLVFRRARHVPLAWLTGEKEFMSLAFDVNKDVLIPRPETEELVENIIDYCKDRGLSEPNIVDVGTGSGVIAVSLAYYISGARVLGIDISKPALKVAERNIRKYNLEERVKVIEGDLLLPLIRHKRRNVDIVVSNPPYIDKKAMEELPPDVKREPEIALYGGVDGLDCYRRLIPQSKEILKEDGLLAVEIAWNQGASVKGLFDSGWRNVELKKDYSGRERMVFGFR
ncbi:MAG: peptide chain release factor N(5)-glutamine methyltransferase [Halanaerobiaceae bacterium]|nr:peptide chain release factor N(5)-glutamine methyltransferase [Halanaerobiaceae bacterium]